MKRSATIFDSKDDKQEVSDVVDKQHKWQSPAPPTHHTNYWCEIHPPLKAVGIERAPPVPRRGLPWKTGHKKQLNTKVQKSKSSLFSCRVRCQECMGST